MFGAELPPASRAARPVSRTSPSQGGNGGAIPAAALTFKLGEREAAKRLVLAHHYSHRFGGVIRWVGTLHLTTTDECVAAAVVGLPACCWRERVVELVRLVRAERPVPLTMLVRLTLAAVRRAGEDLVVSYADITQGHAGTVYQAGNWRYHGARPSSVDGYFIDGVFVPSRTLSAKYGTRGLANLRRLLPDRTIEPHRDHGKHLYWYPLTREGEARAARIGLQRLPYPTS